MHQCGHFGPLGILQCQCGLIGAVVKQNGGVSPSNEAYLEGLGDLVSRLIMEIIGVTIWVIGVINLLTKSP